ncbi:MAG: hypothetical protein K2N30_04290 [Clostridia bacterium]|nr:hypothetical protein [Clostridia bacterium]
MQLIKSMIAQIFELIRVNYDTAFVGKSESDMLILAETWYDCLKEYPQELVMTAVKNAIKRSEFTPKIATVTAEIKKLTEANEKSDLDLWAELDNVLYEAYDTAKYLRYPQHHSWAKEKLQSIYDRLSPEIKLFVVNLSSLIELANMSERTDDDGFKFEKARFLRLMPNLREQAKNRQAAENLLELTNSEDLKLLLGGRND